MKVELFPCYQISNISNMSQQQKQIYVEIKCLFVRITQIDTVNEKYCVDAYIQSRWREPFLDDKSKIKNIDLSKLWNPKLYIENVYGEIKEAVTLEVVYSEYKKKAYLMEKRRIKGVLRETLELQQFPFDCQDLSVVVSTRLHCDEIELIESSTDISNLNVANVLDSQEWELHNHVDVSFSFILSDNSIGPEKRPAMTFTCRASRRFRYFVINHLMISSMLSFLAFCSFAVVSSNTFGRLQVCMVNLLTTVTFKVALSHNLPKISYLTYLDKLVLWNICVIMTLCLWHAITSIFFHDLNTDISNSTAATSASIVKRIQAIENILIPLFLGTYILGIIIYGVRIYFDAGTRRREMSRKDAEFKIKLKLINAEENSFDET